MGGSVGEKGDKGAEKELSEKYDDNKNIREKEKDRTGISERKAYGEDRAYRSEA